MAGEQTIADAAGALAPDIGAAAHLPVNLSPWGMFLSADIVVQAVMIGLVAASMASWTIGLAKCFELAAARRMLVTALRAAGQARTLDEIRRAIPQSPRPEALLVTASVAEIHLSQDILGEGAKERIATRLERIVAAAARRMARGTGILASIGATAPFVGLFGTVWGIMNSFIGISKAQTTNLAVVAPGIAEALLATGLGLFAAIPAVLIYNALARAIKSYRGLLGDYAAEISHHASRDLDRHKLARGRAAE